ncbi:DUF4328 domain-containing protein [Flavobacterium silvaticum]|uniref:DUF4328 domain-containing protein n=1 Tax=Flavobacterium silvaticum TaxID=1852020 RepID=A0A972FT21_9FLAO|nr:DUF4328 domain-containing protein [Flavobacterium silvaticum]NMH27953.1 DUF4328 domain-containing protein [Flavobacterium silvaticum]
MEIRPNTERARIAIIMVWIVLTVQMASLVSAYFQYRLLINLQDSNYVSPDELSMNDLRERLIAVVFLILYLVSGITFIRWFRRAYFNLGQRVTVLEYSDGWAAGSWFVPVLNFFRPFQMMREMYQETIDIFLNNKQLKEVKLSTAFLGWWWFFWILNTILSQVANRTALSANTVEEFIFSTKADMISDIFMIPLSILAVKVISDYSEAEELLLHLDQEDARQEFITETIAISDSSGQP